MKANNVIHGVNFDKYANRTNLINLNVHLVDNVSARQIDLESVEQIRATINVGNNTFLLVLLIYPVSIRLPRTTKIIPK